MTKLFNVGTSLDDNDMNNINRAIDVLRRVSSSIKHLVTNGQLTPTQFLELIKEIEGLISKGNVSIHDININLGKIGMAHLSEEVKSAITGSSPVLSDVADGAVTTVKVADKAVTPEKTNFVNMSENIFDGVYDNGLLINMTEENKLAPTLNYNDFKGKTGVIPVVGGATYWIEIEESQSNVVRVGSHSSRMTFGNYPTTNRLNTLLYSGSQDGSKKRMSVTIPDKDNYIYVYVSNENKEPALNVKRMFVNAGILKRQANITPSETAFFEESYPNLFDGYYSDGLVTYDRFNHLMFFRENYSGYRGKTAIVPVESNTTYAVKVHDDLGETPFRIALHNSLPIAMKIGEELVESEALDDFVYEATTKNKEYIFRTNQNSKYVLIYVSNDGREPLLKIEKNDKYTSIDGNYVIPSKYLPESYGGAEEVVRTQDHKFIFPGEFNKTYKIGLLEDYLNVNNANAINNKFIELVNANDDLATSTLLTTDDLGNDIYKFESKPLDYKYTHETGSVKGDTGDTIRVPKIIITGAIHGSEKGVPHYLYHFLKELLENPTNNGTINHLRQNVHFIIAPLINPSGFNANTYNNLNDVNLNRDFPPYGSVTQKETQAIKEMIDDNSDADFLFDAHNMFARDGLIGYSRTDDKVFRYTATNMFKTMGGRLQRENENFPQNRNHRWAFSGIANVGTIGKYAQDSLGIPSTLYEVPRGFPFGSHTNYDEPITRYGAELTMNLIFSAILSRQ